MKKVKSVIIIAVKIIAFLVALYIIASIGIELDRIYINSLINK